MEFKIDKDRPILRNGFPLTYRNNRRLFYPTMILEINESFDFPIGIISGVRSSAANARKKLKRKFIVIQINEKIGCCKRIE